MEGIKNYLSDMDGVILKGTTLIPGAAEVRAKFAD